MTCDYCEKENRTRLIQLWTGWIKRLCPSCIVQLTQKFRYLEDENENSIVYTDEQNDKWGITQ